MTTASLEHAQVEVNGIAVHTVSTGLRLRGEPVGSCREPLLDLTPDSATGSKTPWPN
ncbi:hypothetical protein [Mycobacterium sp. URHB0021]